MSFKEPQVIPYAFQPIFRTKEKGLRKIYGYEALVRPVDYDTPGEYIKSMTVKNKLHKLEFETFYNAVTQFDERGLTGMLFINSFPYEYLTNEEFDYIRNISPGTFKNIYIESLEYGDRVDVLKLAVKLEIIKKYGFHIALDDFGSGINSVQTLNTLNPDIIKIDKVFISGCTKSQMCKNTVEIIIDYIRSHNAEVLAEGVETYDEFHFLQHLGVDYMQGYYLGFPE